MSKTCALCFIGGSKHLKIMKALGLQPCAFMCFLVFGAPDKALALVFEILLQEVLKECPDAGMEFEYCIPNVVSPQEYRSEAPAPAPDH